MTKWLANANDTLDKCAGIGDEEETRQKLVNITVSTFEPFSQFNFRDLQIKTTI